MQQKDFTNLATPIILMFQNVRKPICFHTQSTNVYRQKYRIVNIHTEHHKKINFQIPLYTL